MRDRPAYARRRIVPRLPRWKFSSKRIDETITRSIRTQFSFVDCHTYFIESMNPFARITCII